MDAKPLSIVPKATRDQWRVEAEATMMISALGEYTPLEFTELLDTCDAIEARVAEAQLARDVLWCKAIVATLDTRQIEAVTRHFNENRPDAMTEETKRMLADLRKAAGGVR